MCSVLKGLKGDSPLDPWRPDSSERGGKEHDSEHLWHGHEYLALLRVMYTIIARVYRPATTWPLSLGIRDKLKSNRPTCLHFFFKSCVHFGSNLSDERLSGRHINQNPVVRSSQDFLHRVVRYKGFPSTCRCYLTEVVSDEKVDKQ